jgi:hypothetical protein
MNGQFIDITTLCEWKANPIGTLILSIFYCHTKQDKWIRHTLVHINISNDNILQIQIIWTTTIVNIEDNITGQKQLYWLEYKSVLYNTYL